jgi:hypothetical protein
VGDEAICTSQGSAAYGCASFVLGIGHSSRNTQGDTLQSSTCSEIGPRRANASIFRSDLCGRVHPQDTNGPAPSQHPSRRESNRHISLQRISPC